MTDPAVPTVEDVVFSLPRSGLRTCIVCRRASSSRAHENGCLVPTLVAAVRAERNLTITDVLAYELGEEHGRAEQEAEVAALRGVLIDFADGFHALADHPALYRPVTGVGDCPSSACVRARAAFAPGEGEGGTG